jgi:hypothetical protein
MYQIKNGTYTQRSSFSYKLRFSQQFHFATFVIWHLSKHAEVLLLKLAPIVSWQKMQQLLATSSWANNVRFGFQLL